MDLKTSHSIISQKGCSYFLGVASLFLFSFLSPFDKASFAKGPGAPFPTNFAVSPYLGVRFYLQRAAASSDSTQPVPVTTTFQRVEVYVEMDGATFDAADSVVVLFQQAGGAYNALTGQTPTQSSSLIRVAEKIRGRYYQPAKVEVSYFEQTQRAKLHILSVEAPAYPLPTSINLLSIYLKDKTGKESERVTVPAENIQIK